MMGLDFERPLLLDETWTTTSMTRIRGRSPQGERLVDCAPHNHGKITTFVAALRADGLNASLVIDGALFRDYVRQHVAPTLRPGDFVVMGNLASHKVAGVRKRSKRLARNSATCRRSVPHPTSLRQTEVTRSHR
jgi:hypothetical protein